MVGNAVLYRCRNSRRQVFDKEVIKMFRYINGMQITQIRKIYEEDIPLVYDLMQGNPLYFQHCPPMATVQSIAEDMKALPPRTTYDDKYYIGFYEKEKLVAVMDLILNFPNQETAFIGFFMVDKDMQGNGVGTSIVSEVFERLKERGYKHVRLGFAKGNPQSEAFWLKNGFARTGVEDVQEKYTVVIMERQL